VSVACRWLVVLTALQGLASPVVAQSIFDGYTRVALGGSSAYRTIGGLRPVAVHAVNNRGDIIGTTQVADLFSIVREAVVVRGATGLTFPFGVATQTMAVALNDRGMVVGLVVRTAADVGTTTLIREPGGTVITVPGQVGIALNNHGDVLFQEYEDPVGLLPRASIRHLDGTASQLTALNAAFPRFVVADLNDRGDVVGFIESKPFGATGPTAADLFLLHAGAAAPVILARFQTQSQAYLNNARQIVINEAQLTGGTRAFLWVDGQLVDLAPGAATSKVRGFNNRGDVILEPSFSSGWTLYQPGQRTPLAPLQEPLSVYVGGPTEFLGITDSRNVLGSFWYCIPEPPSPGSGADPCGQQFFRADPQQPWGLERVVVGNQVTLHWQLPASLPAPASYLIEAGSTPDGAELGGALIDATSTTLSTSVPAAEYHVRVHAVHGGVAGPASNDVVVRVPGCDTPEPPRRPTAAMFRNTVDLTWPPVLGAASYVLTARWDDQVFSFDTGNSVTSMRTTAPDGNYSVDVRARNACGTSVPSPPTQAIVMCLPPAAPQLSASVTGPTVTLDWRDSASVESTFVVDVGSASGAANLGSFRTDTTALSGTPPVGTYYVRVRAETVCGASPPSNEVIVSVTAP
jgi:hypothetical protein